MHISRILNALWEDTYYPAKSLGYSRLDMPQIRVADMPRFFVFLKERGITTREARMDPKLFKPAQKEMNAAKARIKSSPATAALPIIVSRDFYVLDGHHRWLAAIWQNRDVNVIQVSCNAQKFFALVKDFDGVERHDLHQFHSTTPRPAASLHESTQSITDNTGRVWPVTHQPNKYGGMRYFIRKTSGIEIATMTVLRYGSQRVTQGVIVFTGYEDKGIDDALWAYAERIEGKIIPQSEHKL